MKTFWVKPNFTEKEKKRQKCCVNKVNKALMQIKAKAAVCLLQVDALRQSRDRKKVPAGGPTHYDILLQPGAAYQPQFGRRYRLAPHPDLHRCRNKTFMQMRKMQRQRSVVAHFNSFASFPGWICFSCAFKSSANCPSLHWAPLPPSWGVFLLSFYCTQWLYIIETALPFHFHGTNSQLHSSKMKSGGGEGGGGGEGCRFGYSFKPC